MSMRVSTPTAALCLAAAAALLPVPAHAEAASSCAGSDSGAFPLTTRLYGGPDSYRAGGGYGTWYLDLTNHTRRACTGIHPVVVLVDTARALKVTQPHLDFYADGRPHPVRFESTDEAELVGAFTDGPEDSGDEDEDFPGFTVDPGTTLTVGLRLALTSDTPPGDVTANAAVVQRHGDDGDWVGQSNDYRFVVETDPRPAESGTGSRTETAPGRGTGADRGTGTDARTVPPTGTAGGAATGPGTSAGTGAAPGKDPVPDAASPSPHPAGAAPSPGADAAEELASSGLTPAPVLFAVTAALLAAGAALLLIRRRN
ncbi:hypothetical protein [Streptomyces sp. NPDC002588]|uniref:hypothetical protein n=1 Tax=Streptomyces sp. NPDC002588 TaxID=3154419 RepID=UPI003331B0A1